MVTGQVPPKFDCRRPGRRSGYRAPDGEQSFVVDTHVHFWDASPENWANKYGECFINCFYDYHRNLSPEEWSGRYVELLELMELAAQGKVELRAKTYGLDQINEAIDDFIGGQIHGRGVIVPDGRPA